MNSVAWILLNTVRFFDHGFEQVSSAVRSISKASTHIFTWASIQQGEIFARFFQNRSLLSGFRDGARDVINRLSVVVPKHLTILIPAHHLPQDNAIHWELKTILH